MIKGVGKLSYLLNYEDLFFLKKTFLKPNSMFFFQVKFPFQYWIPQKNAIWISSPWFRWHSDPNKDINLWVRVYSSKSVFSSCTFKPQQARWLTEHWFTSLQIGYQKYSIFLSLFDVIIKSSIIISCVL